MSFPRPINDDTLKQLNPGGTYTDEEKAVREWVYKNRRMFIDQEWTLSEITLMARQVQVASEGAIFSVLSHFQDALRGSHFENRAALMHFSFESAIHHFNDLEQKQKEAITLKDSWHDLGDHLLNGTEF